MEWIYLITAGLLEIGWIISLKYTEGFTKIIPMIFYGLFGFSSAYFLSLSLKSLPIGVAYTIWMSIAIVGSTLYGIFYLKEALHIFRFICLLLILMGVIGLKVTNTT